MTGHPGDGRADDGAGASSLAAAAWYLGRDGQQFGPVTESEFHRLFQTGQVLPTDLAWREGYPEWQAVGVIMAQLSPPVAPVASPRVATAPTPVGAARAEPYPTASSGVRPMAAASQPTATAQQPASARPAASARTAAPADAAKVRANRTAERPVAGKRSRRGRIGRGVLWTAIAAFFAITLTAAYLVVAGDKNLLRMATALIPRGAERIVPTAPIGGFARTLDATDSAMQRSALWQVLKKNHAEWYAERVREATEAVVANKSEAEIANLMMQGVVKLRRQYAAEATSAPLPRLKSIAEQFTGNLSRLRAQSIDTCYQFVSAGEGAPAVVALLQAPEHTAALQAQLVATFEAIGEGRRATRIYPQPKPEDYDELVKILEARGWKNADMQLFSDSGALAKASPETVCRLVTEWFESQLAIKDPDTLMRLIVDSLRPVVAG
jgi:GYF domain 2